MRQQPVDWFAPGLFLLLAVVLTGPALFAGRNTLCAAETPDSWVHMWAFWRTNYALHGHDVGYFVSHVITYPGIMREPIAIFDPLLPLMAAALQVIVHNLPVIFNLLVTGGLALTGMAGYLLAGACARNRAAAFAGGILAVANPFVYRQILGGYIEYAWWGLVPLTAWLYISAIRHGNRAAKTGYVISLFFTFLMSIYCAAVFTAFALLAFGREAVHAIRGKTHRLRQTVRLQLLAVLCLAPLLLFWIHHLSLLGYKGIPWNQAISARQVKEVEDMIARAKPMGVDELDMFSTWRTLHGSLDLSDLVCVSRTWTAKEDRRREGPANAIPFLAGTRYAYFESAFGLEWLAPLALAALAFRARRARWSTAAWLAGGLFFLLLALGPFPIWHGKALTAVSLPYAWLYRWVPGFSRLSIPGRAVLGVILCLIVPVARGAGILAHTRTAWGRRLPGWDLVPGLLLFGLFALTGYAGFTLPRTPIAVSPVYRQIGRDTGRFALLELPIRGDFDVRMYAQSIHNKPIYRGVPATFMTEIHGMSDVAQNALVHALELEVPHAPPEARLDDAVAALAAHHFRYLLLHRNGYEQPGAFDAACTIARAALGDPFYADDDLSAWRVAP